MRIAANRAVGGKTAKIAHMGIGKNVFLIVRRIRTVLVDITSHQWQIRMDSQQSI
jgi:hypothetical protein